LHPKAEFIPFPQRTFIKSRYVHTETTILLSDITSCDAKLAYDTNNANIVGKSPRIASKQCDIINPKGSKANTLATSIDKTFFNI
jgi:hypothetical protein